MTDSISTYKPPSIICCCRNGAQPNAAGLIIINAGCKVHGIRTQINIRNTSVTGKDVQAPAAARRTGSGMFHRMAE